MHILLFFSGFLPKGLQRLACQLLNCLFAANTQGINYSFIKILLSLFFTALGLKLTTLHICVMVLSLLEMHSGGNVWQPRCLPSSPGVLGASDLILIYYWTGSTQWRLLVAALARQYSDT